MIIYNLMIKKNGIKKIKKIINKFKKSIKKMYKNKF